MSTDLHHNLTPLFPRFREFTSEQDLYASAAFKDVEREIRQVLDAVVTYGATTRLCEQRKADSMEEQATSMHRPFVRAVAWNIERGLKLDGALEILATHPLLRDADIYFLTELDFGMARTQNRDVPGEVAQRLGLNGVFAPCYMNLDKGSGVEQDSAGENWFGLHGNAIFSRWPIHDARNVRLKNGKDKMRGKEKRIGSQQAAIGTVELPCGPVRCASFHLDAHSSRSHRRNQLRTIINAVGDKRGAPVLLGGDWNTSTHNTQRAIWSIIGFWGRILMGVRYCLRSHYPYPDRFFERGMFKMLERLGYSYRPLNEAGACTFHHSILEEKDRKNLLDWVPRWCLDCIDWALKPFGGVCSLKLDWFAGRNIRPSPHPDATSPIVIHDLRHNGEALSDHDPIVLDFEPNQSTNNPADEQPWQKQGSGRPPCRP